MAVLKSGIKLKKLNDENEDKGKKKKAKKEKTKKDKSDKKSILSGEISLDSLKNIDFSNLGGGTRSGGKMPTKNYINLAAVDEKPMFTRMSLLVLILIVVLFIAFFKFMVVDKFATMISASQEVTQMREDLNTAYVTIESMGDVEENYAHYTYSGMTAEELSRVDRVAVMKLVEKALLRGDHTRSWQLTENVMTLQVSGKSLQQLNQLAQSLEQEEIVERCVINAANKVIQPDKKGQTVTVTFIVYLQLPDGTVDIQEEQNGLSDGGISEAAEKLGNDKARAESTDVPEE